MCGIAGIIGIDHEVALPAAQRMLAALHHRGRDEVGIEAVAGPSDAPPAVFIHARLAIIDLSSAGRQPMPEPSRAPTTRAWLTYNGELYNFRDLRAILERQGLRTTNATDTEVLLLAYRYWGEDALERFRGMFAFALADPERRKILLARDRLGIKPLYVVPRAGGGLLFASEVRTLLAAGSELVPRRLSPQSIESFLSQGAVWGAESHVVGVRQLNPAELMTVDWRGNTVALRRYWSAPSADAPRRPCRTETVGRLGEICRDAVRRHLVADVPTGIFLSGGIDSSAVATLATEANVGKVRTLSVGFDRPDFDELSDAAAVAAALGTEHHQITVTSQDILADFDIVLNAMDQPTIDGFNTFYVSRAAHQIGVKVALSGLGGDEIFGGYASFRDVPRAVRWSRFVRPNGFSRRLLQGVGRFYVSRRLLKLVEAATRPWDEVQLYLLRRELFLPAERRSLHSLPVGCSAGSGLTHDATETLRSSVEGRDPENAVSALEISGYMLNMLLRDADVFSLVNGLELRVPLLDHELVSFVGTLPGIWKRLSRSPKRLLVDAVGARLPAHVTRMPKKGFVFPWLDWFRNELADYAGERLNDRRTWGDIGFDPVMPAALWERFRRKDPSLDGLHILAMVVIANLIARQQLAV